MKPTCPRYFDGRVRLVTEVRRLRFSGSSITRIETLECGHTFSPFLSAAGRNLRPPQYRVCMECPQWRPPQ